MVDKRYGKFVPMCDGCELELPSEDSFQDAIDAMKQKGWTSEPLGEGPNKMWANMCPDCQEAF